ncbi:MAG: MFS transporter [Candidatus Bathyarchaeia archaeon]
MEEVSVEGRVHAGNLRVLCLESFFTRLNFGMVTLVLPFYSLLLGASMVEVGFIAAARQMAATVFKVPVGWLADRAGRKPLIIFALVVRCLTSLGFLAARSPLDLAVVRLVQGVAVAARDPPTKAMLADSTRASKRAEALATYSTLGSVGQLGGSALAGVIVDASGYQAFFLFSFLLSATITVIAQLGLKETGSARPGTGDARKDAPGNRLRLRVLAPFCAVGLLYTLSTSLLNQLFQVYAVEIIGMSKTAVGFLFTAGALVAAMSRIPTTRLYLRFGSRWTLSFSASLDALMAAVYTVLRTPGEVFAARLIDAFSICAYAPIWDSTLLDNVPLRSRAWAFGVVEAVSELGGIVGPIAGGAAWQLQGYTYPFYLQAVLEMTAVALIILILPTAKREPKP